MKKLLTLFVVLIGIQFCFGQNNGNSDYSRERQREAVVQKGLSELRELSNIRPEISGRRTKRLTKEEIEKINAIIAPDAEDLEKYKVFLKQSDTGIFRLLPDFGCETKNIIRVDGECENFVPGKWAYSFRQENYADKELQDMAFTADEFVSNGLLTQGILVSLGDLELNAITLNSKPLNYLTVFVPATDRKAVGEQYRQISIGVEKDGYLYTKKVKVEENTTYALRTIAYKFKDKWSSRLWFQNQDKTTADERKFGEINSDRRNDLIIGFRVIRKSENGSITILWKQLSKEKSPRIVYEEDEKLEDFNLY